MKLTAIMVCVLILALTLPCFGFVNQHVKYALHLLPGGTTNCQKKRPVLTDETDLDRDWPTYDGIDVWLVVYDWDSVTVVEYGLDWPSAWGTSYYHGYCGDLVIGAITNPGDGVSMAWTVPNECRVKGENEPAFWPVGYNTLYPDSDGDIMIIPNPATGKYGVVNCGLPDFKFQEPPNWLFHACVGDPCEPQVPIEPTTWGSIKTMFR
jgi:hypothetical protein